jgi:hypothetical protein
LLATIVALLLLNLFFNGESCAADIDKNMASAMIVH